MDLALDDSQEERRRAARALLAERCPPERVRALRDGEPGFCPALWQEISRAGWLGERLASGLSADPGAGHEAGPAASLLDRALTFEELARASTPGPYLAHAESILALEALGAVTSLRGRWPGVVRPSLALLEESGSPDLASVALRVSEGSRLSGKKIFVPWAADCDLLLVVARSTRGALGLFAVENEPRHVRVRRMPSLDSERIFEVEFDEAPGDRLGGPSGGDVEAALELAGARATILTCAELAGAAAGALTYAVDYVGRREQFGRPIGSFQAIQHHCANMALDADAAHWTVMDAASRVDAGESSLVLASRAKLTCSRAARRVTTLGHQVLGGVGFLEDCDMHLWTRRVKVLESRWGTPDSHAERIADALGLP